MELTDEQLRAVSRRAEPLLVSAAAGSGKTSVLVERAVGAIREDGVAPAAILAITFTERAAGELRERLRARLLALGERAAARDVEAAFIGTFHGFCARLLRAHALAAGLAPDFAILDEALAARLRERAYATALTDFLAGEPPDAVDLVAAYRVDRVRTIVEGAYAELRSRGQRFPRLPSPRLAGDASREDRDGAAACALLDMLLGRFGAAYEQLKRDRDTLDFDDLELRALELLAGSHELRTSWSERFTLLMVDEFQDTNPRQLALLRALERDNLFTVGDELQSIYAFRHADVELFRARRGELAPVGASLELKRNFRSRPALLAVVNRLFAERFEDFTPLLAARPDEVPAEPDVHVEPAEPDALVEPVGEGEGPQLRLAIEPERPEPVRAAGLGAAPQAGMSTEPRVELLLSARTGWDGDERTAAAIADGLPRAPLWRQAEARLLAQRVGELVADGQARPGEIAVLLRGLGDVEVYERALRHAGLPTLASVGGFWRDRHVGDLLAYLRVLANPLDGLALYGALASPLAGCSSDALALLAGAARAHGSVWEAALTAGDGELAARLAAGDRDAIAGFCAHVRGERERAAMRPLAGLIEPALDTFGYRAHVSGLGSGQRGLANVNKLARLARDYEAREGRDLRGFLDLVTHLQASGAAEPEAPLDGADVEAVRLMSVHAAKGLEFPVVCVADLGRAANMGMPALLLDGERVGLRLSRLDGMAGVPTLDYDELCDERRRAQAAEEDRILYVAITRARERLLLSGAVDLERWPQARLGSAPVAWLGPALDPELAALVQDPTRPTFELAVPVRCTVSSPASVGDVLRLRSPAPARPHAARAAAWVAGEQAVAGEAAGADAGGRVEQPDMLSYTSISEFERCGYRYYLERVLGVDEARGAARRSSPERRLQARARGTLAHRVLEDVDLRRAQAPSAEDVAQAARELGLRVDAREREELARLIAATLASAPMTRAAGARRLRREHPFAFAPGPHEPLLTGVLDVLAEDEHGATILDYKSDRVGPHADLEALVAREYGAQRLVYAVAALRGGAERVEVIHLFLERPHDWVGAVYGSHELDALESALRARVARVRSGRFEVSDAPHLGLCLTCPGRAALCSWSDAQTMRESAEPAEPTGGTPPARL